ncbi:MAG: glycosyltransferase [Candidatus Staskawiczbacteria bacterium]|nr:glycosyltransferase [Candidatus Staskawiczbacteria bacterium]
MPLKERRTIAFFFPSFEIGGAERNALNLLCSLNAKDYAFSLVLAEKKGGFVDKVPKNVIITGLDAKGYLRTFLNLKNYLKNNQPDILVSAFPHFNIICILAVKLSKAKTKIVITEHIALLSLPKIASSPLNSFVSRFFLPVFIRLFYLKADQVICVSKGVAEDILKIAPVEKLKVIYNPIVNDNLINLSNEKVSHKWLINNDIPVVAAAGRLASQKDYPMLFKAIEIVLLKKSVRLIILGEGPEELKLKKMVETLGLSKNVDFLGFQSNPYKYIKKSSVFVLSSVAEGFGNVLVEAMACGVPVVSTRCPFGPDEIIEDNKSGILVPVQNPKALAEALLRILNNKALAKMFSNAGRKRAEFFSVEKSAKEYEKVFNRLLK